MAMFFDNLLLEKRNALSLQPPLTHHNSSLLSPQNPQVIQAVGSMSANIMSLGFIMSQDLFNSLCRYSLDELQKINKELVPALEKQVGANIVYNPMYRNFPDEVMEKSDLELYINAVVHYFSEGRLYPESREVVRFPLFENTKLKPLTLGNKKMVEDVRMNLFANPVSYSDNDKMILREIYTQYGTKYFPDTITNKENLVFLTTLVAESKNNNISSMQQYYKTPTDILRYITARNGGDITLSTNTQFHKIPTSESRSIFTLLNNICSKNVEISEMDIRAESERWKRVFHQYHPGKFHLKYVSDAMNKVYNNTLALSFEQRFAKDYAHPSVESQLAAIKLLKTRPGIFARKLDYLLRTSLLSSSDILNEFKSVADKVSPKVLLTLSTHFNARTAQKDYRAYLIKGPTTKTFVHESSLPSISEELSKEVRAICMHALMKQYRGKELGVEDKFVYIEPALKQYKLPVSQRDTTNNSIGRGTRFNISDNKNFVRAFIHWTDMPHERVDIDLSVGFYDDKMKKISEIAYYDLKTPYGCHSGDITSGGKFDGDGVAEFIDIDIKQCEKDNIRYACFYVNQFTGRPFSDIPCDFGFMEREKSDIGKIYEPSTVRQKIELNTKTESAVPMIFDIKERQFIWADLNAASFRNSNLHTNQSSAFAMLQSTINSEAPSVYDLIYANVTANKGLLIDAEIVDDLYKDKEITVYSPDTIQMDELMNLYLNPTKEEPQKEMKKTELQPYEECAYIDTNEIDDYER